MSKELGKAVGLGLLTFGLGSFIGGVAALGRAGAAVGQFLHWQGTMQVLGAAAAAFTGQPTRRAHFSVKGNQFGAALTLPICFGKVRVGGPLVFLGTTGTKNEYLHYAVPVACTHAGGTGALLALYINGRKIAAADIDGSGDVTAGDFAGLVNVRWYNGTATQNVDSTLDSAFGLWASTATGRRVAYAALRFYYNEANDKAFQKAFPGGQAPAVEVAFEGCKVYDPRADDTNGGTGAQRYATPTTWAYNANPILCDATYKIMSRKADKGWGVAAATGIDWDTVADGADVADGDITVPNGSGGSTTIDRYACGVVLDTKRTKRQNSELILSTCLGKAVQVGSQFKLYAGAYDSPATTIDETWLAGGVVSRPKVALGRAFNAFKVIYTRADNDFKDDVSALRKSAAYEAADGDQYLEQELSIPTDNEYRAQYLALVQLDLSRYQRTLVVPCNAKMLDLEPWEPVTVDIDTGHRTYTGTFRVVDWDWNGGSGTVTLQEYAAAPYSQDVANFEQKNATSTPSIVEETPPTPTGLAATGALDQITLDWDPSPTAASTWVVVFEATSSGGSFSEIDEVSGGTTRYIIPKTAAVTRYYKIKRRDSRGNLSAFSSEVTATSTHAADGATAGADWATNLTSRPGELTDGRVSAGLDGIGDLNRNITSTRANSSNVLRRTSGGLFSGDLDATLGAAWGSNLSGRPTELTDGRVATGLNGSGNLQSAVLASATIDGTVASTVRQNAADGDALTVAGSNIRLADARNGIHLGPSNPGARTSNYPNTNLAAEDDGATATVTIIATTLYVGSRSTSNSAASATGLAFSTAYDVGHNDANLAGGAPTLIANTRTGDGIAQGDAQIYDGGVTTPADGGIPTGGNGGGGGYPP